jgi:hypothetical protein
LLLDWRRTGKQAIISSSASLISALIAFCAPVGFPTTGPGRFVQSLNARTTLSASSIFLDCGDVGPLGQLGDDTLKGMVGMRIVFEKQTFSSPMRFIT